MNALPAPSKVPFRPRERGFKARGIVAEGILFPHGVVQVSEALGVAIQTVYLRIRQGAEGWYFTEDKYVAPRRRARPEPVEPTEGTPRRYYVQARRIMAGGREFRSVKAAATRFGISTAAVEENIRRGCWPGWKYL